jgi:hypothetical protein
MGDRFFPVGVVMITALASAFVWFYAMMSQLPLH